MKPKICIKMSGRWRNVSKNNDDGCLDDADAADIAELIGSCPCLDTPANELLGSSILTTGTTLYVSYMLGYFKQCHYRTTVYT